MCIYNTIGLASWGEKKERNTLIISNEPLISWTEGLRFWELKRREQDKYSQRLPSPPEHPAGQLGSQTLGAFFLTRVGLFPWREGVFASWCFVKCSDYIVSHIDMTTSPKQLPIVNTVFTSLASCYLIFFSCIWNRTHQLPGLADTLRKRTLVVNWLPLISVSIFLNLNISTSLWRWDSHPTFY